MMESLSGIVSAQIANSHRKQPISAKMTRDTRAATNILDTPKMVPIERALTHEGFHRTKLIIRIFSR